MKIIAPLILTVSLLLTGPALAQEQGGAVSGIDIKAMDTSVRPQDDFYNYVNGTWIKETEMPADKSRYSMFSVLSDRTQEQLQAIIQDASKKDAAKGTNEQKLGDMYNSFLDVERIEELGYQPVKATLNGIAGISDKTELATRFALLERDGVAGPFGFYVYPDAKSPGIYGLWMYQSGLTMPDRDYYLKTEEKYQDYRKEFVQYATDLLGLVDYPNPGEAAQRILALETEIATRHLTRVESRDAEKNYNKRSAQEVKALMNEFPWDAYAQAVGLGSADELIVRNYAYFEKFGELYRETDLQTWKDYLAFQALDHYADSLSSAFENRHFQFHSTTLNGVPENEPRWKRAVSATSGVLGEVLGQEYVKHHFSPKAKKRMETLVANLMKAYGESIQELEWMSDETKEKALAKLAAFKPKIGYPDKWRDYSGLTIEAGDLIGNFNRSARFEHEYNLQKIGQPVDPVDWGMTPQTVNAYYSPTRNEIVFPAAILQPPFFNMDADDAVNYGAIGGVIGHEIG
ncbi:MAG: M13 family metallopeptidase, partial [Candidatus Eremiobacteraeota bacterium]|nr:M13 family metallopeptidase [Candidatus Eremiobacteraeota bacterium]